MSNKSNKSNKKALACSVLSLVLCFVMLLGVTFAWFQDTASTKVGEIKSGVLDVTLEMKDENGRWVNAENTEISWIGDNGSIIWVPGASYSLPELRVVNKGDVAMRYKVSIEAVEGDKKLLDVIEFTGLASDGALDAQSESAAFTVTGTMMTNAGNEYAGLTITSVRLSVSATQINPNAPFPEIVGDVPEDGEIKPEEVVDKNVVISLTENTTLDVTAHAALALGSDETETITINGNGYTLTFNHLNSDWSNIVTNNDAKLILNNVVLDNSGHNDGPWNRHDLNFACEVEMNDVYSKKAIALKNNATLNNVDIYDDGDIYGLWITGNGQTVNINGGSINSGRCIKISDQYISTPTSVTLNVDGTKFISNKKAAILVGSTAGADITLSDIDITETAADTVNAVWNDSDWADYINNVHVTGGTLAQEQ